MAPLDDDAPTLTHDEWQRGQVVDDDLRYLMDEWAPRLDEGSLRRDVPILRRLLIEYQWGQAWRSLGLPREPYVSASSLDRALHETTRDYIQFASAPPATEIAAAMTAAPGEVQIKLQVIEDVPAGSVVAFGPGFPQHLGLILVAIPPEAVANRDRDQVVAQHVRPGRRHVRALPVAQFLASPFALITGVEVSRRDVIKYVANKLGGVHFDPSRRPQDAKLHLLDQRLAALMVHGTQPFNVIYVELLSIIQFVAESGDAARYRDVFSRIKPPQGSEWER
jgi:hypothetical protein